MDIGKNIASFFNGIFTLLIILFLGVIVFIILFITQLSRNNVIKSKTLIKPEIELTTDGKIIDTIYIYKKK